MKKNGFTLIEITIALFIIGCIALMFSMNQTQQYQKNRAKDLASQSLIYAKLYGAYMKDVERGAIYNMTNGSFCVQKSPLAVNSSQTISLSDLQRDDFGSKNVEASDKNNTICTINKDNYYNNVLSGTNMYKQKPCLGVTKSPAGKLQGFLFWVSTSQSFGTPLDVARSAAILLGGKGGYVMDNKIIGQGGWSLPLSDVRFSDPQACGGTGIAPNSIVINMDQLIDVNDELNDNWSLARESDNDYAPGDAKNKNTAKTDIFLNNKKLILNSDTGVSIQANDNQVNITGDVYANSLTPTESASTGDSCLSTEVDKIKRQNDPSAGSLMQQSTVICTDSELVCSLYGHRFCYLPVKKSTIRYSDPKNTGWMGTQLICPGYAPFLNTATVSSGTGTLNVYSDSGSTVNYCNISNSVQQCKNSYAYSGAYVSGSPTMTIQNPNPPTLQDLISTVHTDSGDRTMRRGVQAVASSSLTSCATLCGMISFGANSSTNPRLPAIPEYVDSHSGKSMCLCRNTTSIRGKFSYSYASIERTGNTNATISSAICTSKIFVEAY